MRLLTEKWLTLASASVAVIALAAPAQSEMTEAAGQFLTDGGINQDLIAQASAATETELAIPQEWLDKAKEEGPIDFGNSDTSEHVAKWLPIFNARFPDVEVVATETSGNARAVQPLLAYKAGKLVRHVVVSFESSLPDYEEADALQELDDLPALSGIPENMRDPKNRFSGLQSTTWCMTYNTELVSKDELPATWWDLVAEDSPFKDGRVGAINRVHLWTINLWGHPDYGPEKMTNEFLPAFFNTLKPQLRKEGVSGAPQLAIVGEFDIALPTPNDEAAELIAEGVPLGFHCPEPVPQYYNLIGMFRNSPTEYSSKILINWMLSQDGQLTRFVAGRDGPAHKDLQTEYSTSLGEAFAGKEIALRTIDLMTNEMPKLYDVWNPMWTNSGGPPAE
jgi:ABC-type Fe3+ transport system substrate-binding protein